MARQYYTLLQYDPAVYVGGAIATRGYWAIAFGDYERATVEQELSDVADSECKPKRFFKIIRTSDRATDIAAKVARINEEA